MQISRIKSVTKQGENIKVEFKECRDSLGSNVFETVCAFLNRFGGELLLGVKDNGRIEGIDKSCVERMKKDFVLATIHRAENTDNKDNLRNIWRALGELAGKGIKVFFPVHPRTKKVLKGYGLLKDRLPAALVLSEPVSYLGKIWKNVAVCPAI